MRRYLKVGRRDGRKVFVQVIGTRWPKDWRRAGEVIAGPWLDSAPIEEEWARQAKVGEFSSYVSGHTRYQRIL